MESTQLRSEHVRQLVRLIGETHERARAGECRRRVMVSGLSRIIRADIGIYMEVSGLQSAGGFHIDELIDIGWSNASDRELVWSHISENGCPITARLLERSTSLPRAVARSDMFTDSEWHGLPLSTECHRSIAVDDVLIGYQRLHPAGPMSGFVFKRAAHSRPFAAEERSLVQLFLEEIGVFQGGSASETDALGLAPREVKVLALLRRGLSEKEAAGELGISPHTLHGYVKDLYRKLGVSSRAELLARHGRRL